MINTMRCLQSITNFVLVLTWSIPVVFSRWNWQFFKWKTFKIEIVWFKDETTTLSDAEVAMLELYVTRAGINQAIKQLNHKNIESTIRNDQWIIFAWSWMWLGKCCSFHGTEVSWQSGYSLVKLRKSEAVYWGAGQKPGTSELEGFYR